MLSPKEKKDKIIRSTDLDALSCRHSCNQQGYFEVPDPNIVKIVNTYAKYLGFCAGYTGLSASRTVKSLFEKKFPLINRGTYLRTVSISNIVSQFADLGGQIVSMGGGSDTRGFQVLKNTPVKYVEIDFPETTRIKKLAIASDPELSSIVGVSEKLSVDTKEQFQALDPDIVTDHYCLLGIDLRDQTALRSRLEQVLDLEIPTLVLSECVLCYLNPQENEQILNFWTKTFTNVSIAIYEPISLSDSFGKTMEANLHSRGISLLTFNEFPTLESKSRFLRSCGFDKVRATDLSSVGGYSQEETWFKNDIQRINSLELIDEVEEINLLLSHYCLIYAEKGAVWDGVDQWNWRIKSDS